MKCLACDTPNRPGATACKQCRAQLPPNCAGCGEPVSPGRELCSACRTERVPAALGAELDLADISEIEESGPEEGAAASHPPIAEVGAASHFVGQQATLQRLIDLIEEARTEREPRFIALIGLPGMGKTRIAQLLAEEMPERGVRVLYGAPGGPGAVPFRTFACMLQQRFQISDEDKPKLARDKLSAGVAEILPDGRATEIVHLLAPLLGIPFADSPVVQPLTDNPTQLETRMFIAARRFLAGDAEKQPLLLILDDVERSSPEAVNLTHYLAAGLAGHPVVLLALARPNLFETHPSYGQGDVSLERIDLGPLSSEEAEELFLDLTRGAGLPPAKLVEHARDRLAGSPRALIELVRYLVDSGLIRRPSATSPAWSFDLERIAAEELPATLGEIIDARFHTLDPSERDLLEKAAVCGKRFWLDALVSLVRSAAIDQGSDPDGPSLGEIVAAGDGTRAELAGALKQIEERGLIVESPSSIFVGEREYHFAYPPWWEVVSDNLDADARRRYHRLLAQWLELRPDGRGEDHHESIAHHLESAGDGVGATRHYRIAAERARDRYFNDRAIRLYLQALQCVGPGDIAERIHLWLDLGSVYQLKGDADNALSAFEHMLRLTWTIASRTKVAVAFNKMGRIYRQKNDLPLALEYLERGLQLFEQMGDERGVAGSLDDIGQALWLLGRYDEALDRSAAALEKRRHLGDKRSIALSLVNIGQIERHRGLFDAAEACYREALDLRRSLGHRGDIAWSLSSLGVLAFQRGDLEGARLAWEEALSIADEIGALNLQAGLEGHLGELARALGNQSEARTRFERSGQVAADLGDRRLLSEATRNLGQLELAHGNNERAFELCTHSLELAEAAGIPVSVGRALIALGEVQAATLFDDASQGPSPAADSYQRGVDVLRRIGNEAELALALQSYGRYRVEQGDVEAGRVLLTEAHTIFERLGMKAGDSVSRMITELS